MDLLALGSLYVVAFPGRNATARILVLKCSKEAWHIITCDFPPSDNVGDALWPHSWVRCTGPMIFSDDGKVDQFQLRLYWTGLYYVVFLLSSTMISI